MKKGLEASFIKLLNSWQRWGFHIYSMFSFFLSVRFAPAKVINVEIRTFDTIAEYL